MLAAFMKGLHPGVRLEGALEGVSAWRIWWRHVRKLRWTYLAGAGAVVLTNITDAFIPQYTARAIDALQKSDAAFTRFIPPVALLLVLAAIGRVYWRQLLGQQTHYAGARMRSLLWERARYLPRERLTTDLSPGELMSLATSDVGLARMMFGFTIVGTVDFVFLLGLSLACMLSIDPWLTAATLIIFPPLPFILDRLSRREALQHNTAQTKLSELTELAAQAVATQKLQRVSQTHVFWEKRLAKAADVYRHRRMDVAKTSLLFIPVTGAAPLIAFGILLMLGVERVLAGHISIGQFVALQSYVFLVQQPMLELGVIISEWQRSKASFQRLVTILAQPAAPGLESEHPAPVLADLAYVARNLSFRYPGASYPVFEGLNLELKKGARLGLMGPLGSGKSTLLEIFSGLETRFEGELKLFDRDVRQYSHADLRRFVSVVPQRPFLFSNTIAANMRLDRALAEDEVWHWLEVAGVAEDVKKLPEQLETRLGEWGVNLSGGQKQRLTLARALARRPMILLLDDCLSAVDTLTEERILQGLNEHLRETTLVWVAHRPSTLRHCDTILDLGEAALLPPARNVGVTARREPV